MSRQEKRLRVQISIYTSYKISSVRLSRTRFDPDDVRGVTQNNKTFFYNTRIVLAISVQRLSKYVRKHILAHLNIVLILFIYRILIGLINDCSIELPKTC